MVDQLLGGLFGGQDDDDDDRRQTRARDFVSRYEQGSPYEGYSDDEAVQNYRSVAGRLSPQEYEEAAAESFGRLSPEDRKALKRQMRQRGGAQFRDDDDNDDPRELARIAARQRDQDQGGGGLAGLFGFGDSGGSSGGNLMNASRGGGGGGLGDMMGNPVAKAAMAGVAAIAMRKIMSR